MNFSRIIGIDGEGYTDRRGRHRYTYMAACDSNRLVSELHDPRGLSSAAILEWILSLPREATLVGFSLGYDFTKWVEGMRDGTIYSLTHPDLRQGEHGPRGVKWEEYRLNKVSRKFSVSRRGVKHSQRIVWDVWAFFQTSFVSALRKWGIGSKAEVKRIERMKARRSDFAGIGPAERAYCRQECMLLAALVTELVQAHASAGLALPHLYGPGSTASVMLAEMGAHEHVVKGSPALMRAIDRAFTAGRFENSCVGPIRVPTYSYDLASAYPYGWCLLPCFKHGRMRKVSRKAMLRALAAGRTCLVHYRLHPDPITAPWGPLPHRLPSGDLVFPASGAGGWAWSPEVVQALKWPSRWHLDVRGGYVLDVRCRCGFPFRSKMVGWYKARLKWGNKGRGRVLRLGMNSCTGKAMQSVGQAKYRCMARAGLVTSHTRARLLEAILSARDPWSVRETATDSVLATEPLKLTAPVDLGTTRAAKRAGSNPLGAWAASPVNPHGVFLCRPGMRFRLGPDAPEETASRGLSRRWLHSNRARIMGAFERHPLADVPLPPPDGFRLFIGAKTGIRRVCTCGTRKACFTRDPTKQGECWSFMRDPKYGRWVKPKPRGLSFAPEPKRETFAVMRETSDGPFRMVPWELPMGEAFEGLGYSETSESEHARKLREHQDQREEQG